MRTMSSNNRLPVFDLCVEAAGMSSGSISKGCRRGGSRGFASLEFRRAKSVVVRSSMMAAVQLSSKRENPHVCVAPTRNNLMAKPNLAHQKSRTNRNSHFMVRFSKQTLPARLPQTMVYSMIRAYMPLSTT